MKNTLDDKRVRLFVVLAGFFVTNALIAEFVGVKIFALEDTLGLPPLNWNLFGQEGSLMFTAGVLLWPIVFIMTDVINEYFGMKGVRMLSYLVVGLIIYGFVMIYFSISLSPAEFWVSQGKSMGIDNMQAAFAGIYGQSNWIIIGSVVAFLVGQVLDAYIFYRIRKMVGEGRIWLRATVSTLVSQCIDSFVVLYIAFVLGPAKWEMSLFWAVGTVNYSYKFVVAILLIPTLYLAHYVIDGYLGKEQADEMRRVAVLGK
ncbi:MAG: queuosine precursor transporter [Bacteroidota bacterium]